MCVVDLCETKNGCFVLPLSRSRFFDPVTCHSEITICVLRWNTLSDIPALGLVHSTYRALPSAPIYIIILVTPYELH
jgi:hypothetical protein